MKGSPLTGDRIAEKQPIKLRALLILLSYVVFCAVSLLSRWHYPFFGLVVLAGIALPVVWGNVTGAWSTIGFTGQNLGKALRWGVGAGVASSLMGLAILEDRMIPSNLALQLWIGVPFWLLVISPFQEFFFRGWMQSGFGELLGEGWGLITANLCFTVWYYLSPIVDMAPLPLTSVTGVTSTFAAGLVYAYAYHRSRNILSPWLGHALSGIVFVVAGAMDFGEIGLGIR